MCKCGIMKPQNESARLLGTLPGSSAPSPGASPSRPRKLGCWLHGQPPGRGGAAEDGQWRPVSHPSPRLRLVAHLERPRGWAGGDQHEGEVGEPSRILPTNPALFCHLKADTPHDRHAASFSSEAPQPVSRLALDTEGRGRTYFLAGSFG